MRCAGEGIRTERSRSCTRWRSERPRMRPVVVGGLGDLAIDAEQRVQRRHRILQDHGDRTAANAAHLAPRIGSVPRPRRRCGHRRYGAAGGSSPTMERQVVVLPQPDLPIRPSVSPSFNVKLMPSTAFTTRVPPERGEVRAKVGDFEEGADGAIPDFTVIARSAATRQSRSACVITTRLLRRCASRNDRGRITNFSAADRAGCAASHRTTAWQARPAGCRDQGRW